MYLYESTIGTASQKRTAASVSASNTVWIASQSDSSSESNTTREAVCLPGRRPSSLQSRLSEPPVPTRLHARVNTGKSTATYRQLDAGARTRLEDRSDFASGRKAASPAQHPAAAHIAVLAAKHSADFLH